MRFKQMLLLLCVMAVFSGCAEVQRFTQDGPTAITYVNPEIKFLRETIMPEPRHCPISQLQHIKYFHEQKWAWYRADKWFSDEKPDQYFWSCPDKNMPLDGSIRLTTWTQEKLQYQPSLLRQIGPALTTALGYVGAAATLGMTMPGTVLTNNNAGVNLRASTVAGEVPGGVPR